MQPRPAQRHNRCPPPLFRSGEGDRGQHPATSGDEPAEVPGASHHPGDADVGAQASAEGIQCFHPVGCQDQARATVVRSGGAFQDGGPQAATAKADAKGQATHAAAGDHDVFHAGNLAG